MERPAQRYFCNKCGYVGNVDLHPGCGYLAYHLAPFEQNYIDQMEKELADIKKLATSPASAPAGWKLVPVEPTQAMSEAAMNTFIRTSAHETEIDVDVLYHAMLAASPTPPVSEDRKDAERYLWLRASDFDIFGSPHAIHLSGKELDQAIDAAMQEDKKP